MANRYIDPLIDFAFKKIFGSEPNKDLLIDLLNEVFRGRKVITDLEYSKNEYPGETENIGGAILDLVCIGPDKETFLIEVQRSRQEHFKERILYYSSRIISDMAPKGGRRVWNYRISEVYVLVLMDNFTFAGVEHEEYLHNVCLYDLDLKEIFYDKYWCIYIELHNFAKAEDELKTDLDKWLYVLKNLSKMDKLPAYLRKPVFKKLFNISEYSKLTK